MAYEVLISDWSSDVCSSDLVNKGETALSAKFPGATFSRYATVSGKVAGELVCNGILAVVLAVVGIGLFAMFRFEWQFGISTVVAILHDVLMAMGFFASFREWLVFDLTIVAAVLTIVGYSINDNDRKSTRLNSSH